MRKRGTSKHILCQSHNKSINLTPGGAGYPSVMFGESMNLSQLEKQYCYNAKRTELAGFLKAEISAIQYYIEPLRIIVFGSFIEDIDSPGDIDVLAHGRVKSNKLSEYIKNGVNFRYPNEIHVQRDFKMKQEWEFQFMEASDLVRKFSSLQSVKSNVAFIKNYIEVVLT